MRQGGWYGDEACDRTLGFVRLYFPRDPLVQAKQELQQSSAAAAVELATERARVRDLKAQVMVEEGRARAAELAARGAADRQLSVQPPAVDLDVKRAQPHRSKAVRIMGDLETLAFFR